MKDQRLEVTAERQWAMLSYMICIHGIILGAYYYFYRFSLYIGQLIAYLIFFLLDACPTLFLHFQYLAANRGTVLLIRPEQRTVSYTRGADHFERSFDELDSILYVTGFGNGAWYSFSEYRYCKLLFKDGRSVVITCLMVKDIKYVMERAFGMQVTNKTRGIPYIGK